VKLCLSALLLIGVIAVPCRAEWQAAAYLGSSHTQNGDIHIRQPALASDLLFRDASYRGESFESPQYYGVRGGYFFEHFGVEAEFIHLKVFANLGRSVQTSGTVAGMGISGSFPMSTLVQRFSVSHGMNLLFINFVARKQFLRAPQERLGRILINGRAGVGGTIPHAETEITSLKDEHYQWGRVVFHLAGGAEIRLWRKLYALGEYKFTRTDQRFRVAAGNASTLLRSHHGVFGLGIHF
jgi:lipid A oxidase